jgi:hypothetical protein
VLFFWIFSLLIRVSFSQTMIFLFDSCFLYSAMRCCWFKILKKYGVLQRSRSMRRLHVVLLNVFFNVHPRFSPGYHILNTIATTAKAKLSLSHPCS